MYQSSSSQNTQPCVVVLGSNPRVVCGGTTMTSVQIIYEGASSTSEPDPTPNADGNGVGVSVISMPESPLATSTTTAAITTTTSTTSPSSTVQTTSAAQTRPPPPAAASPSTDTSAALSQTTSSPADPGLNVALSYSDSIDLGEMGTATSAAPATTPDAANFLPAQPVVNLDGLKLNSVLDLGTMAKATPAAEPPAPDAN